MKSLGYSNILRSGFLVELKKLLRPFQQEALTMNEGNKSNRSIKKRSVIIWQQL